MSNMWDYREMYQDGRTDGRTFARNNDATTRQQELRKALKLRHGWPTTDKWYWYYLGYTEIIATWIDGEGA